MKPSDSTGEKPMNAIAPANAFRAHARPFLAAGVLSAAEVEAVALVAPRFGEGDEEVLLGLAFVAAAPRLGHVVIELTEARELFEEPSRPREHAEDEALPWPENLARWHTATIRSELVGPERPFVAVPIADGRFGLTTHRRNAEEAHVAALVRARAATPLAAPARTEELVRQLFGAAHASEAAEAVRVCAANSLTIVTGGPGTGKTFSLTRLLAVLALAEPERSLRVRLAAPTGKAAARMGEAIREGLASLPLPEATRALLAAQRAETVHRTIGLRPDGTARFDERNPLQADLVVVDEASMIDLALMRALLRAVPLTARLVLLGDPDQLASVEAGAVLDDFVNAPMLAAHRAHFTVSRRFGEAPTLAACAHALQTPTAKPAPSDSPSGQLTLFGEEVTSTKRTTVAASAPKEERERLREALELLRGEAVREGDPRRDRLTWLGPLRGREGTLAPEQWHALAEPYANGYVAALRALPKNPSPEDLARLLAQLDLYRVLAVHRRGPTGVETLAQGLEQRLLGPRGPELASRSRLRHGLPILVLENAPEAKLTNGDVGIALELEGTLTCIFPGESGAEVRRVAPSRLPSYEGAFALTVHKSQGSQFREVALVLAGRSSPIQTRELVYTALTRAKEAVRWLGGARELEEALTTRTKRRSTLRARLTPTET